MSKKIPKSKRSRRPLGRPKAADDVASVVEVNSTVMFHEVAEKALDFLEKYKIPRPTTPAELTDMLMTVSGVAGLLAGEVASLTIEPREFTLSNAFQALCIGSAFIEASTSGYAPEDFLDFLSSEYAGLLTLIEGLRQYTLQ